MRLAKNLLITGILSVVMSASVYQNAVAARIVITDLPPGIVRGDVPASMDILYDAVPAHDLITRLCYVFYAACGVVGVREELLAFSCRGGSKECWRIFVGTVRLSGIRVRVLFNAGGASYEFYIPTGTTDAAAREFSEKQDTDKESPDDGEASSPPPAP